jgi:hypothetical protein
MNLVEYVGSSPIGRVDPLGQAQAGVCGLPGSRRCPLPTSKACCDGKTYSTKTHCCEDGKIVQKVTYWICHRPVEAWYGRWVDHFFICCDGPFSKCYGHANNDLKMGDPIPPDANPYGTCTPKQVCPNTRKSKCVDPVSPRDAGTFCWNCRNWALCEPPDEGQLLCE